MKNNKNLILSFIITTCLIVLSACGSDTTQSNQSSQTSNNQSSEDQTVYTIKYNIPYPDLTETSVSMYNVTHWFKEEVEKKSNGQIKVDLYFNGQLAGIPETLDSLARSSIDMAYVTTSYYGDVVPEGFLTYFPYWAESLDEGHDIWNNTEVGEIYKNAFLDYGVRNLSNTFLTEAGWILNKPVRSVEDMDGLLITSIGGLYNTWFEELGVTGVELPQGDWYDALSRGVIDGGISVFTGLKASNFGEVVDYVVYPTWLNAAMASVLISEETWKKVPEDLQKIIQDVAKEGELKGIEEYKELLKEIPGFIEEYDIEVITLSDEEEEKFYQSVQPMWDEFAALSDGTAKMIEIIREYRNK